MDQCKICGRDFKDYQGRIRSRCGSCNTKIRRYRTKAAAVQLLGGACSKCGWRGNQVALQFHHKDPKQKDFIIGKVANKSWDAIRSELEKCILLCANCHAIQHSSNEGTLFVKEAQDYHGRSLDF